jgi:DNA-binding transcriptional ArsR family regulator
MLFLYEPVSRKKFRVAKWLLIFISERLPHLKTTSLRRDVFQAIADPTRRQIIDLLAHAPLNLNSIADKFEISRPAISKHIRILTECGLVTIKQEGRERYCSADVKQLKTVADWTTQYYTSWSGKPEEPAFFPAKTPLRPRRKKQPE